MSVMDRRLKSLDVGRGITIMGMLIVNNPGDLDFMYSQLLHVKWNGLHFADLGVPAFLYIVGVSLAYSLGKRISRGEKKSELYKKICYRSVVIYGIGVALDAFPFFQIAPFQFIDVISISTFMGILQRIAISYFLGSIIYLEFRKPKTLAIWIFVLIAIYQVMLMQFPVPVNFEAMYNGTTLNNLLIFGQAISATALVLLGALTGNVLRSNYSLHKKGGFLLAAGLFFILAGLVISYLWPINKILLSVPFVMVSTGVAMIVFSILYWVIEIKDKDRWTLPFEVFGTNALLVFVGSVLFDKLAKVGLDNFITVPEGWGNGSIKSIVYTHSLLPATGPYIASMLYAVLVMLVWLGIVGVLYRYKLFIKV